MDYQLRINKSSVMDSFIIIYKVGMTKISNGIMGRRS